MTELVKSIDVVLLDCDGVLWRGDTLIEDVKEALQQLRQAQKRLYFITNNASKSREQYVRKFASFGITIVADEVLSSSYAAGAYLSSLGLTGKVLVAGTKGLLDEVQSTGLDTIWVGDLNFPSSMPPSVFESYQLDPAVQAVVLGLHDTFNYAELCVLSAYLRETQCHFVATNTDAGDRVGSAGRLMPGCGTLVAALAKACGREPVVVGKEGDWLLQHLEQLLKLQPERTVMVGDRLDTDMVFGKRLAGGVKTVLVLTGVATREEAEMLPPEQRPDLVLPSLASLIELPSKQAMGNGSVDTSQCCVQ